MRKSYDMTPWQVASYLEDVDGKLQFCGVDAHSLAEQYGTPLFIYSESRLRENARRLQNAFKSLHSKTKVCYASKACTNVAILQILKSEGLSVEINSGGEMFKALTAGFDPKDICLNGVSKTDNELKRALEIGIKVINIDSVFELGRVIKIAETLARRAQVALRVVPQIKAGTTAGCETGSSSSKFGIELREVAKALQLINDNAQHICLTGLHIHIGSQVTNASAYYEAAQFMVKLVRDVKKKTASLTHVNIGGGFPINYVKYNDQGKDIGYFNTDLSAEKIAESSLSVLKGEIAPDVEILVEPGRSMVGDAAVMLSRVESSKMRGQESWIGLDAGYNLLLEAFSYKWYFHMINATRSSTEEQEGEFRVYGPLCDSGDALFDVDGEATLKSLLEKEPALLEHRELLEQHLVKLPPYRRLPKATCPGDLIAFLDVGAYTQDQIQGMNGRLRPAILLVEETGNIRVVRSAEKEESLLLNEVFSNQLDNQAGGS